MRAAYAGCWNSPEIESSMNVNELLQYSAPEILALLGSPEREAHPFGVNFNWLGFGQATQEFASEYADRDWALVAIDAYRRYAETLPPERRMRMELSSIYVRVRSINQLGADAHDPLLDPQVIFDWFRSNLGIARSEAMAFSDLWREAAAKDELIRRDRPTVLRLRRIKNALGMILALPASVVEDAPGEIGAWVSLRDRLP